MREKWWASMEDIKIIVAFPEGMSRREKRLIIERLQYVIDRDVAPHVEIVHRVFQETEESSAHTNPRTDVSSPPQEMLAQPGSENRSGP